MRAACMLEMSCSAEKGPPATPWAKWYLCSIQISSLVLSAEQHINTTKCVIQ
jgi:hypothetical protein